MKKSGVVILEQCNSWLVLGLDRSLTRQRVVAPSPEGLAQFVHALCNTKGLDPSKVILVPASDSVLAAKIPSRVVAELKTNESIRYHLESHLPLDAESMVADFVASNSNRTPAETAVAVAVELDPMVSVVDALESMNIRIQAIVPRAILQLQQAVRDGVIPCPSVTIWPHEKASEVESVVGTRVDAMQIDEHGNLLDWQVVDVTSGNLAVVLQLWESDPTKAIWIGTNKPQYPFFVDGAMSQLQLEPDTLTRKLANLILNRTVSPWIDLRRDRLASHAPLRRVQHSLGRFSFVLVGTILVSICLIGWMGYQYQIARDRLEQEQREIFSTTFPDQRIPAGIMTRLRSELAKTKAVRSTDKPIDISVRALPILHQALAAIPLELVIELNEARVENGRLVLEMKLVDQKDVGTVAAALSRSGFNVEPPATSLVEGTKVQTTVMAELPKAGTR